MRLILTRTFVLTRVTCELGDVIIVVFNVKVRNLHALVIIYRTLLIFCTDKSNLSELGDVIIVFNGIINALVIIYRAVQYFEGT